MAKKLSGPDELEQELDRLRREQARRVMPLIGPLLDAWDQLPNDLRMECEEFGDAIDAIDAAMEQEES